MATDVHQINPAYLDRLRQAGATDREILDTAEITGFFSYYTRLVDALGVEPEDFMKKK